MARHLLLLTLVLGLLPAQIACAGGGTTSSIAHLTSNAIIPFMALGELSLFKNGVAGKQESVQAGKALLATTIAVQLLKHTVNEQRPNSFALDSFPSGHTADAFAIATSIADYEPKYKWPAYGLAAAVGWSRVQNGEHYWHDVVAGALIGHLIASHFAKQHIVAMGRGVGVQWKW